MNKFIYKILDSEKVAQLAYDKFPKVKCAQATFEAIIESLSELERYKNFPTYIFSYGKAGIYAWNGTCGVVNGTLAAMSLILGGDDQILKPTVDKFMEKFLYTKLPITNFEKKIKVPDLTCGGIIFRFLKIYGGDLESKDRKEFCKGLAYSAVKIAVDILNDLYLLR